MGMVPARVPRQGKTMGLLFWLFAARWFDDDFALRPVHLVIVGTIVLLGA